MTHYVYTTARGLVRTVEADTVTEAYARAKRRHRPDVILSLAGEAWLPVLRDVKRSRFADITPEHARTLLFRAVVAQIPNAMEGFTQHAEGERILLGALAPFGLVAHDGPDIVLTDLGHAFVAWAKDGAS